MTPTGILDGQEYAYGFGRVGVLQQRLLTPVDIDHLVGAHNEQELKQVFNSIKFTSHIMQGIELLDDVLPSMERWIHDEVDRMVPEDKSKVFEILWLREDASTLSYLLKKKMEMTSDRGTSFPGKSVTAHDIEDLRGLVFHDKEYNLPDHLVDFVRQIKMKEKLTPQHIDADVAQYIATTQLLLAKESDSKIIVRYIRHTIDLENIRTIRRLKPGDDPEVHLLKGGEIDVRKLTPDLKNLASLIRTSSLPFVVADNVESGVASTIALEHTLVEALTHDITEMRRTPLSVESIFAFAVVALSQLKLIRTILIGKSAGLTTAEIREMLPPLFSTATYAK